MPSAAQAVSTSHPNRVIGNGSPGSCTSAAVVRAVAKGGVITFNCGPNPVTITMTATAKVVNTHRRTVIDGGGKVTLSGGGKIRILYMNTCDPKQHYTTSDCWQQKWPQLVVQNMTFTNAYSACGRPALLTTAAAPSSPRAASSRSSTLASSATAATSPAPTSAVRPSARSACTRTGPSTSPTTPSAAAGAPTAAR